MVMKLPFKERVFLSVVVMVLAAVLIALAVMQYHWSRVVSDATSARLQANLESSMFGWRDDLYRELTSVFTAIQADPTLPFQEKAVQYAQQYQSWSQTAPHSNLVAHVFLLEDAGAEHARLLQLNTADNQFEAAEWPADLGGTRAWIQEHSADFVNRMRGADRARAMHPHQGFRPGAMGNGMFPIGGPFGADAILAMINLNEMALIRRQISHGRSSAQASGPTISWTIVTLDRAVLEGHIFPELAEAHFSGSEARDYLVAIVGAPGASVIYSTDPGFGSQDAASVDGKMPIFGPPRGSGLRKGANPALGPAVTGNGRHDRAGHFDRGEMGFGGPVRIGVIQTPGSDNDWRLLVRHRKGSLEAVVTGMRRRNLALSFGVLLVLAAGIGIIVISSQRARVLARLQMDFVAAVSHELRTPLAVISSAAENIVDGVVAGRQQLSQYGAEIKSQARHLIQLVEQILLFAAARDKRHHYNVRPVRVVDVIEAALKDTAGVIDAAGVTVEREIAPNLPPIVGDLPALSHCLQNLITNAVKYGGDARWMRIKASAHDQHGRYDEVQISVEDKGLGISAADVRRIFEPFYRSRAASAAQIHGTGLGLSLARDIAQAMGGSLTVSSEPGKGSCFTVYLPFADVSQLQTSAQTAAAVNPKFS